LRPPRAARPGAVACGAVPAGPRLTPAGGTAASAVVRGPGGAVVALLGAAGASGPGAAAGGLGRCAAGDGPAARAGPAHTFRAGSGGRDAGTNSLGRGGAAGHREGRVRHAGAPWRPARG